MIYRMNKLIALGLVLGSFMGSSLLGCCLYNANDRQRNNRVAPLPATQPVAVGVQPPAPQLLYPVQNQAMVNDVQVDAAPALIVAQTSRTQPSNTFIMQGRTYPVVQQNTSSYFSNRYAQTQQGPDYSSTPIQQQLQRAPMVTYAPLNIGYYNDRLPQSNYAPHFVSYALVAMQPMHYMVPVGVPYQNQHGLVVNPEAAVLQQRVPRPHAAMLPPQRVSPLSSSARRLTHHREQSAEESKAGSSSLYHPLTPERSSPASQLSGGDSPVGNNSRERSFTRAVQPERDPYLVAAVDDVLYERNNNGDSPELIDVHVNNGSSNSGSRRQSIATISGSPLAAAKKAGNRPESGSLTSLPAAIVAQTRAHNATA